MAFEYFRAAIPTDDEELPFYSDLCIRADLSEDLLARRFTVGGLREVDMTAAEAPGANPIRVAWGKAAIVVNSAIELGEDGKPRPGATPRFVAFLDISRRPYEIVEPPAFDADDVAGLPLWHLCDIHLGDGFLRDPATGAPRYVLVFDALAAYASRQFGGQK